MTTLKEAADVLGAWARDEKNRNVDIQIRIEAADRLAAALTTATRTLTAFDNAKAQLESDNAALANEKQGLEKATATARNEFSTINLERNQKRQDFAAEAAGLDLEIKKKQEKLAALELAIAEKSKVLGGLIARELAS